MSAEPCVACAAPLLPENQWYALPAADRRHMRDAGWRRHGARGLCINCYYRLCYRGDLIDYERRNFPADDLLDEWAALRDDGYSIRDAAPRIGVTFAALDKALCRALRGGDPRGRRRPMGRAS